MSIFKASNKLTEYNVTLTGETEIDLIKEVILSVEISYSNYTPVILGRVILDDLYDLNLQVNWDTTRVTVSYIDIFDLDVSKDFVVTKIIESTDEKFKKTIILELQDLFSYKLGNSFLSKSFNTTVADALNEYITHLALEDTLEIEATPVVPADPPSAEFVVPNNVSNLEFFLRELNSMGFAFYQTKLAVVVKSLASLVPSGLEENSPEHPYMSETDNQLYKNKIIDIKTSFMSRNSVLPRTKILGYNWKTKTMDSPEDLEIENDNTPLALGDNAVNLQLTPDIQEITGFREVTCSGLNFDGYRLDLKNGFMDQSAVEIIVNGYATNDINQVYNLELKGNTGTSETQSAGNQVVNGKYVSAGVTDKIVGDTLIQKIKLHRADMNAR